MKRLDLLALVLVAVGALNWGLVAVARFDLVAAVFGLEFGETNAITRIVYGAVGISGVWVATRIPSFVSSGRREVLAGPQSMTRNAGGMA